MKVNLTKADVTALTDAVKQVNLFKRNNSTVVQNKALNSTVKGLKKILEKHEARKAKSY